MAHKQADRIKDTSTTTGTGSFTVSGTAASTYRTLSTFLSVSDTFYYVIEHTTLNEWESGLGTYSSANVFARTTVLAGTNGTSAVNFSAGTKSVMNVLPALTGRFHVDPVGVKIGTAVSMSVAAADSFLTIAATNDADWSIATVMHGAHASSSSFAFAKSRNATPGSHTIVQSNDVLGIIYFLGSDGTNYEFAASISVYVDGTPGNNDMPGMIAFATTPDGSTSPVDRVTISQAGTLRTTGGAVSIGGVNGLNVTPGSDVNCDLITVDVTDAPTFGWSETFNVFVFSKAAGFIDTINGNHGMLVQNVSEGASSVALMQFIAGNLSSAPTAIGQIAARYATGATGLESSLGNIYLASAGTIFFTTGSTVRVTIDANGKVFLGDTTNADVTLGLTLNQGAADDQIFALKSSDIAHGLTSLAETDTYGYFMKESATLGGLRMVGLAEDTTVIGMHLIGVGDTTTTKSTAGTGMVVIDGQQHDGDSIPATNATANSNILAVRDNATTRFILDSDGDSHQDVGTAWTNFDHIDDVETLNALAYNVAHPTDPIKEKFGEWMAEKRELLQAQKIAAFNANGHHFVNMSKLAMLHTGAIRQLGEQLAGKDARLAALEAKLAALETRH